MLTPVSFFQTGNDDVALFTEYIKQIPRVGELVSYSFEPHDRKDWDPEVLASHDHASELVNRWRVTDVQHLIRRISARSDVSQVVAVFIEPVE